MTTLINGVDVPKVMAKIDAVRRNPAEGAFTFSVVSRWESGMQSRHAAGDFKLGGEKFHHKAHLDFGADMPECMAGTDTGMNPAEMLLASLSACLISSYAVHASAMHIKLQELAVEISGEGDIAGFFGIGNGKPGLTGVSVRATVRSTDPKERLQELHRFVTTHSLVWDTLASRVHMESKLVTDAEDFGAVEL